VSDLLPIIGPGAGVFCTRNTQGRRSIEGNVDTPARAPQKSQTRRDSLNDARALEKRRRPSALWGSQHPLLPVFFDDLTRHDFGNLEVEAANFDALE
jgi:hypothetical protein